MIEGWVGVGGSAETQHSRKGLLSLNAPNFLPSRHGSRPLPFIFCRNSKRGLKC